MQWEQTVLSSAFLQGCCPSSPRESCPTLSWPSALMVQELATTNAPTCWTTMKWRPTMASWLMPRRTRRSLARPILTSTVCRSGVPVPCASTETWIWKPVSGSLSATMTCQSSWRTVEAPLGQTVRYTFQHLSLAPGTNQLLGSVNSFLISTIMLVLLVINHRGTADGWYQNLSHYILMYKRDTKSSSHTIKRTLLKQ